MVLGVVILAAAAASDPTSPLGRSDPPARWTYSVDAARMFDVAEQQLRLGDRENAERILSLLSRDPSSDIRNEARFRHAKLLLSDGRNSGAAILLRQILDEKPDATAVRLQLAQVLQQFGDVDGALRELRAAQATGLPPSVARIVDRYSEALRAKRPFGITFEMALAPDSNINRATRSDTLGTVFGDFEVDSESKAKSGTGLSLRGQTYRRFKLGEADNSLLARISGAADLYPKGRFNDVAIDFALGPELIFGRQRLNIELGVTERWFGQKPFQRSARVEATLTQPLGSRAQLRFTGAASLVDNRLNDLQDGKVYSGKVQIERALSATTGLGASFGLDRQSLRDPGYSTTGWRASVLGWRDVGRMTLTAGVELGKLHADERLLLFPDKREDRYTRLSIGATFRRLQVMGFAPVMRFSVERNRSSIEFYDYKRTRTEFGISRAF